MASHEVAEAALVAVVGIVLFEGLFLSFVTYRLYRKAQQAKEAKVAQERDEAETNRPATIEDVFLLHRSGLLLKHHTRRVRSNVDADVVSGMLVAVQDFIKDSFRGETGQLKEIRFGEIRVVVLEGTWTILAALVRGTNPADVQPELAAALSDLESRYEEPLVDWDGTMESMADVERIMSDLAAGRYRNRSPMEPPLAVTK